MTTLAGALGLPPVDTWPKSARAEAYGAMVEAAFLALRGGVVVSFEAWAGWDPLERQALADAGDRLAAVRAADAGAAAQSPEAAVAVLARADGGAAAVQLAAQRHADRLAEAAGGVT